MWRFDAGRTAASPVGLPAELQLQWVRRFPQRVTVWEEPLNRDRMAYDRVFEPVVMGTSLFLAFNDTDKVMAFDTATGAVRWTFYTDGPVRLPPVAWGDSVLFASDDGYLYCVGAADGRLRWRFRGGPSDRKVLGNRRLVSMWPARGGPVVQDGTVYFAASIWPFMGTFIYALDAETGKVVWTNDRTSAQWVVQPHHNPAFAGVAPQGAFVASGDRLLIPGGRSVPACFDRKTGKQVYYHLDEFGKSGGSFVCAAGGVFCNHHRGGLTRMYDLAKGHQLIADFGRYPVLTTEGCYVGGDAVTAYDFQKLRKDPKRWQKARRWQTAVKASGDLIKAGSRLYAGGDGHITAVQLPTPGQQPTTAWTKKIDGKVERLIAGDGKLFAVMLDGRIMAFGAKPATPRHIRQARPATRIDATAATKAKAILDRTGVTDGYALVYGIGDGSLLEALAQGSDLTLIAVDPDRAKVDAIRRRFDAAGLYGRRVAAHEGTPFTLEAPPYMASLTVIADLDAAGFDPSRASAWLARIFKPIRPYGGTAWIAVVGTAQGELVRLVKADATATEARAFPGATARADKDGVVLRREGPLPGSGSWTHQYGDAANTVKSDDTLVRMPLGVLWFGGNSNLDVLPRHGHGPPEQIIGGRLFIEGMDGLSARDVYTGRVLWLTRLGDLGTFDVYYDKTYETNQAHIPGANVRGTNFVATHDAVYVIQGGRCHVLDWATGEKTKTISLPAKKGTRLPEWAYIGICGDTLVGGSGFVPFSALLTASERKPRVRKEKYLVFFNHDRAASRELVVMDRHTGQVRWQVTARYGFINNGVAIAQDTLFCLDKLPPYIEQFLRRRGKVHPGTYRLRALDLRTGKTKWETSDGVFGTWLGYSAEHDVLLQASRPSGDMVRGEEGKRMIAYRGKDGTVLWNEEHRFSNPPMLHGDKIITHSAMYSLLTGKQIHRRDPLTGKSIPWKYLRTKGCGYHIASEHLLTFRSSAASYYDLSLDGGTGHFGGFKSGCSSNLIAADGVLNAPEYTRTCTCSFQNQTSLALIHMPDVEVWTTFPQYKVEGRIRRVGINLGAPGDRRTEDGTLWLEHPVVGGASPKIEIRVGADVHALVPRGSVWKYLDNGSDQGTVWRERSFDDSRWAAGPAELGYGDGDEKTVVGYGPDKSKKHITTYFRRSFEVADARTCDRYLLRVKRDDGAVVYLNGREVLRVGMPRGAIDYRTPSTGSESWDTSEIDSDLLANGTNVLAVEIHQRSPGSSDISFDLDLTPVSERPTWMLHHASWMAGDGPRWVGASGAEGLTDLAVTLSARAKDQCAYTVRLYFAELRDLSAGQRVFSVYLQGREALSDFDIAGAAGGARRTIVREVRGVRVKDVLAVKLVPSKVSPVKQPLLCGIEVRAESAVGRARCDLVELATNPPPPSNP